LYGLVTESALKHLIANQHLKQRGSKYKQVLQSLDYKRTLELPRPLAKRFRKSLEDHNEEEDGRSASGCDRFSYVFMKRLMRLTLTRFDQPAESEIFGGRTTGLILKHFKLIGQKKKKKKGQEG